MCDIRKICLAGLFAIYSSVALASSAEGPEFLIVLYILPMFPIVICLAKSRLRSIPVITGIGFYFVLYCWLNTPIGYPPYSLSDANISNGLFVVLLVLLFVQILSFIRFLTMLMEGRNDP